MKTLTSLAASAVLVATVPAFADAGPVVGLGFEGLQVQTAGRYEDARVHQFYDGGYSQSLSGVSLVKGPNDFNVTSTAAALATRSKAAGGTENFGPRYLDEQPADPSHPPLTGPGSLLTDLGNSALKFDTSMGAPILNFGDGFTTAFSLYFASDIDVAVTILDVQGKELASATFGATGLCTIADDSFCAWSVRGISFAGTATSVRFDGLTNLALFDNVTFGSLTPTDTTVTIPEPSTLTLLALGLAAVGGITARRRRPE